MSDPLPSSPASEGREELLAVVVEEIRRWCQDGCQKCDAGLCSDEENDLHPEEWCSRCLGRALVSEVTTHRASLTEAQAEIERLRVDRDSWRRCADAREAERLELRRAFLDFVIYVRGESPSLLTDESIDAYRVVDIEARLKTEDRCRACGGSGFVAAKQCIDDGYGEVDSCPECCSRGAQ